MYFWLLQVVFKCGEVRMSKKSFTQKDYVLSISFANYLKGISGMAKVLMEHQKMYNNKSVGYVNLFVVKKYLFQEKMTAFCYYGLVINGEYKGIYSIEQIINFIKSWNDQGKNLIDIHLHHLLYVKLKQIDKLLCHIDAVPIKLYLHDYYTVCWNYTLLKNGESYCGPQKMCPSKCNDCRFYYRSKPRVDQIQELLAKYKKRILVVSPSEATKNIWLESYPEFREQTIVIKHQKEIGKYRENLKPLSSCKTISIAFLGMPAEHKGWKQWQMMVENYKEDYRFVVFNSSDEEYQNMEKVKIQYSPGNLSAMTKALRDNDIQVALLWAKWPETYSYTFYESLSDNLYIITNRVSGNITNQVEERRCGIILEDVNELYQLFGDKEELRERINDFRIKYDGGPYYLKENDEIVEYSLEKMTRNTMVSGCINLKLHDFVATKLLNILYHLGKIPG